MTIDWASVILAIACFWGLGFAIAMYISEKIAGDW